MLEEKIEQEKMEKRNLQRQIKQLNKEKAKLMDIIDKSEGKMLKDK